MQRGLARLCRTGWASLTPEGSRWLSGCLPASAGRPDTPCGFISPPPPFWRAACASRRHRRLACAFRDLTPLGAPPPVSPKPRGAEDASVVALWLRCPLCPPSPFGSEADVPGGCPVSRLYLAPVGSVGPCPGPCPATSVDLRMLSFKLLWD
jgi:hypothetical protein